jgi:hypothetical protein
MVFGCINDKPGSEIQFRERVLSITEEYAKTQLNSLSEEQSGDGVILLRGSSGDYLVETQKIFIGLIDEDKDTDALVTLIPVNDITEKTKHLVILGKKGNPFLFKIIESDMKILQLKDRMITADVPEYPRSSPLFNCHECREIVKYRLVSGELVKTE